MTTCTYANSGRRSVDGMGRLLSNGEPVHLVTECDRVSCALNVPSGGDDTPQNMDLGIETDLSVGGRIVL